MGDYAAHLHIWLCALQLREAASKVQLLQQ
jgi:hypothetical protein